MPKKITFAILGSVILASLTRGKFHELDRQRDGDDQQIVDVRGLKAEVMGGLSSTRQ